MRLAVSINQPQPFPPQTPLLEASPQGPAADREAVVLAQPAGQPVYGPNGRGVAHPERLVTQLCQYPSTRHSGSLAGTTTAWSVLEIFYTVAAQESLHPAINRQVGAVQPLSRLTHPLSTGNPLDGQQTLVKPGVAGLAGCRSQSTTIAGSEALWLRPRSSPHAATLNRNPFYQNFWLPT
jgi:hypothetical protein